MPLFPLSRSSNDFIRGFEYAYASSALARRSSNPALRCMEKSRRRPRILEDIFISRMPDQKCHSSAVAIELDPVGKDLSFVSLLPSSASVALES